MSKREISILIKARNAMASGLGAAKRSMQAFGAGILQIARKAKVAMAALTVAAIAAAREFAKFEAAARPFARFTGGLQGATQHLKDLQDIGRKGVIPTDQIIQASRELMQFSDGLMGSAADMKALADVAATTGNDIGQVTSGVRDFIRAVAQGRDVDRASRQIQQLGIVSLAAREELRRIQEQGGSTQAMFDVLAREINNFSGGVESDMNLGAASFGRFREAGKAGMIQVGQSAMTVLVPAMDALAEAMDDALDTGLIEDWADTFAKKARGLGPIFDWLGQKAEGLRQKLMLGTDTIVGMGKAFRGTLPETPIYGDNQDRKVFDPFSAFVLGADYALGELITRGHQEEEKQAKKNEKRSEREARRVARQSAGFGAMADPEQLVRLLNDEGDGRGAGRVSQMTRNLMSRLQRAGHQVEQYGAGAMSEAMQEARAQMTRDNQTRLMERSVATEEAIRELLEKNLGAR